MWFASRRDGCRSHATRDAPSWLLWYLDTQQRFAALAELCTLGDEPESVKVHIRAADDGDELLLSADELVVDNIAFQAREGERARWLSDRAGLYW